MGLGYSTVRNEDELVDYTMDALELPVVVAAAGVASRPKDSLDDNDHVWVVSKQVSK